MSKEKTGAARKAQLLEIGAKLAAKNGAKNVTRRMVAKAGGVSEALVSRYLGSSETAQKAYARKAKALGLSQPSKEQQEAIGVKLRAHGPRDARDTRKRSIKEVKAIQRKLPKPAETKPAVKRERKPAAAPVAKPLPAPAERKPRAARAPKAPPVLPPLPLPLPSSDQA